MQMRILGVVSAAVLVAAWTAPRATRALVDNYTATLTGTAETPPNASKGTGGVMISVDGNKLRYTITVKGLSAPANAAHIHVGKPGESGPPVLTLSVKRLADGEIADNTVDLSKGTGLGKGVTADSLKALLATGAAYVNVHTATFPDGELRGQLGKQ